MNSYNYHVFGVPLSLHGVPEDIFRKSQKILGQQLKQFYRYGKKTRPLQGKTKMIFFFMDLLIFGKPPGLHGVPEDIFRKSQKILGQQLKRFYRHGKKRPALYRVKPKSFFFFSWTYHVFCEPLGLEVVPEDITLDELSRVVHRGVSIRGIPSKYIFSFYFLKNSFILRFLSTSSQLELFIIFRVDSF